MKNSMTMKHNDVELEVEYETEGDGSGPSYSPMTGADSGDPLIVIVLKAFRVDNNEEIKLSDSEAEKIAEYITEHHEFDHDDPDWDRS